jgi:hypothetical protein
MKNPQELACGKAFLLYSLPYSQFNFPKNYEIAARMNWYQTLLTAPFPELPGVNYLEVI